jgi:hypothetical protein
MTLWQMMAVAALAVAMNSPADKLFFHGTITLAILQAQLRICGGVGIMISNIEN